MERTVKAPLQDLGNRIRYRVDVLKDTYEAQLELLDGGSDEGVIQAAPSSSFPRQSLNLPGSSRGPIGSGSSEGSGAGSGLKAMMGDLNIRNEELKARMKNIRERTLSQQQRMALVHTGALKTKTKLSQSELDYRRQLGEWHSLVQHMDVNVDSLRRKVREQSRVNQGQGGQGQTQGPVGGFRPGGPGSARKGGGPFGLLTPGKDNGREWGNGIAGGGVGGTGVVSMTPPPSSKGGGGGGYKSPGFGSGPAHVYGGQGPPQSPSSVLGAGVAGDQSVSAVKSPLRRARSAYSSQSPANRNQLFGLSSSSSVNQAGSSSNILTYSTIKDGLSSSKLGYSSPLPTRSASASGVSGGLSGEGSGPRAGDLPMDMEFYEKQLNSQQEVLDLAGNSISALEERVKGT